MQSVGGTTESGLVEDGSSTKQRHSFEQKIALEVDNLQHAVRCLIAPFAMESERERENMLMVAGQTELNIGLNVDKLSRFKALMFWCGWQSGNPDVKCLGRLIRCY